VLLAMLHHNVLAQEQAVIGHWQRGHLLRGSTGSRGKIDRPFLRHSFLSQDDRFSLHSGGDRSFSPSFYHFKPHKTVIHPNQHLQHPHLMQSSLYKETRPESPFFRAGNSYTGNADLS